MKGLFYYEGLQSNEEPIPDWFQEDWCLFNGGYAYHNGIAWIFLEEEE